MRRKRLLLTALCLLAGGPLAALDLDEPDEPGQEEALNRALWDGRGGLSYERMRAYAASRQAAGRGKQAAVVTLSSGWRLQPAGRQAELGRLPFEAAAWGGGLVVLENGWFSQGSPTAQLRDPQDGRLLKSLELPSLFPCARAGARGELYISGGADRSVFRLGRDFQVERRYPLPGFAAGLLPLDGERLAVTLLFSPDGQGGWAEGRVAILDTRSGELVASAAAGALPWALARIGEKLYAAIQGEERLQVYSLAGGGLSPTASIPVGRHPSDLLALGGRLWVANADSDSLSWVDGATDRVLATRRLGRKASPFGAAPSSLASDGERLYAALAGANAVAVLDLQGRSLGAIPAAWYPAKVLVAGGRLYTVSAKGVKARRPNPTAAGQREGRGRHAYVLQLLQGSLGILPLQGLPERLAAWTRAVRSGSPLYAQARALPAPVKHVFYIVKENRTYDQVLGDLGRGDGDPRLCRFPRAVTPNHHALAEGFVTLDRFFCDGEISVLGHSYTTSGYAGPLLQWMGNMGYSNRLAPPPAAGAGKGGSFYPFGILPALASPDYLWDAAEAAGLSYRIYGEDYYIYARPRRILMERLGPAHPLHRRFEARMLALANGADRGQGYTRLMQPWAAEPGGAAALLEEPRFRSALSKFYTGDASLAEALQADARLKSDFARCLDRYPRRYPAWDLEVSDMRRAQLWREDFEADLEAGQVPALEYIWLPNDHTAGDSARLSPDQYLAQNDAALGLIVQTLSHSSLWKDSLLLAVEDDAQGGPDHVDATRTLALAAGPWVKRGALLSETYDQVSLLRTVELLLGLKPLGLADALACPLFGIFSEKVDLSPYSALKPQGLSAKDAAAFEAWPSYAPKD